MDGPNRSEHLSRYRAAAGEQTVSQHALSGCDVRSISAVVRCDEFVGSRLS